MCGLGALSAAPVCRNSDKLHGSNRRNVSVMVCLVEVGCEKVQSLFLM